MLIIDHSGSILGAFSPVHPRVHIPSQLSIQSFDLLFFSCLPCIPGIIGGNGAGKSTLFRMIMGQQQPDAGELIVGETVVPMWVDQSREGLDASRWPRRRRLGTQAEIYFSHLCFDIFHVVMWFWLVLSGAFLPMWMGPVTGRGSQYLIVHVK
jgi:ABC transporter